MAKQYHDIVGSLIESGTSFSDMRDQLEAQVETELFMGGPVTAQSDAEAAKAEIEAIAIEFNEARHDPEADQSKFTLEA